MDSLWHTLSYSVVLANSMAPPREFWGLLALLVVVCSLVLLVRNSWVESKPNEWLLVIRNGKLMRAGVGLKTYATPLDTIVTFPSKVERVHFEADNVTKEMQGVNIAGFAFWSVYRGEDGPFRCYKYMQGIDTYTSVQALCESVLRNLIANSTLDEVMKQRTHLRVNIQKDLKDQFKGWGIWLETVEITEVKICSSSLFHDLQAEFRQDTILKAELIKIDGEQELEESKLKSELRVCEREEKNNTKQVAVTHSEDLKRRTQKQDFESKQHEMNIKKLEREQELQSQKQVNNQEKATYELMNKQKIEEERINFEIQAKKRAIELDKELYDGQAMRKYRIDAAEAMYKAISVKDVKVSQYDEGSSLLSLLPTLHHK